MARVFTPDTPPQPWKFNPALVDPAFAWYWRKDLILAMPFWELEGTVRDYSGRDNHGVLSGAPEWKTDDRGPHIDFPEAAKYLDVADNPSLDDMDELTIVVQMLVRSLGGNNQGRILDKDGGTNDHDHGWMTRCNTQNRLQFGKNFNTGNWDVVSGPNIFTFDVWTKIAIVANMNTGLVLFYKDGSKFSQDATLQTGPANASSTDLRIGGRPTDNNRDFDGLMNGISVWRGLATPGEIAQLHGDLGGPFRTAPSRVGFVAVAAAPVSATFAGGYESLIEVRQTA